MKFNYTNEQIVGHLFKKCSYTTTLDWLDYERLWEWQETWFKRTGYSDGFYRSIVEAENEKLLEKKNYKRNNSRFNSIL